jgi:ubiquinone biosynthesis protein
MKKLILIWFKRQAAKAARTVLSQDFKRAGIEDILDCYWKKYLQLGPDVPRLPTLGGNLTVHLAAMSTAFYQELTLRGISPEKTTDQYYEIAWKIYQKMGKFSWWLASWGNHSGHDRLLKATRQFRAFPFNSPSYLWKDVAVENNVVGFNCIKCPVAEYFQTKGLSDFCVKTWCALDYPLAEMWNAKLERTGSIAGGAQVCDFRWKVKLKDAPV